MMDHSNIWLLFAQHPQENSDEVHRSLVGKFVLHNGRLDILEDHGGFLDGLEKKNPESAARKIWSMDNSPYFQLVSLEDIRRGDHPELEPYLKMEHGTMTPEKQEPKEDAFEYHRQGMEPPQRIVVRDGNVYLDGHPLVPDEIHRILDNARSGAATIRHPMDSGDDGDLEKMESLLVSVAGVMDPGLPRALMELRKAERDGHIDSQSVEEIKRHLFRDTLIPEMGNLKAYRDFLSRPRKGIHVHLDGNQIKGINDQHGHETGNQTIRAMGLAIRSALDEAVGRSKAKAFHTHGDEFIVHVPSHEEAAHFSRVLRSKLEALPPAGGTHNLSVSIGLGMIPEHAENALQQAKAASHQANYAPGKAQQHVHSLIPGYEGPVS